MGGITLNQIFSYSSLQDLLLYFPQVQECSTFKNNTFYLTRQIKIYITICICSSLFFIFLPQASLVSGMSMYLTLNDRQKTKQALATSIDFFFYECWKKNLLSWMKCGVLTLTVTMGCLWILFFNIKSFLQHFVHFLSSSTRRKRKILPQGFFKLQNMDDKYSE